MWLDDDDDGRLRTGVRVIAEIADAAREEKTDVVLVFDLDRLHGVYDARTERAIVERYVQGDPLSRGAQPPEVTVEKKRLMVIGAQGFVDALSEEKTVVEDRHDRRRSFRDCAVDIDVRLVHSSSRVTAGPCR